MDLEEIRFLGRRLALQKQMQEAEFFFKKVISISPNDAQTHFDLGYLYLLQGKYAQGWEEFEWRHKIDDDLNRYYRETYPPGKQWHDQDLSGKRILIHSEQGVGDGIHFLRYLKSLKLRGAYIVLEIHEPTAPLLREFPWADMVCTRDVNDKHQTPEYDYHCSIMSLPWKLQEFDISGEPYIQLRHQVIEFPKPSVGIVWGGTQHHVNDTNRSIPLRYFESLPAHLFGMQVEPRPDLGTSSEYTDLTPRIQNLHDTAVFLKNLDLLICCDTAVAHLAGAIGTPCWLLLPYIPDWRWGLTGSTTPWYDNLKLFRQSSPGDWDSVFKEVEKSLNMVCNEYTVAEN